MIGRIILTVLTLVGGGFAYRMWSPIGGMLMADSAGAQFNPSNTDTLKSLWFINAVGGVTHAIEAAVFLILLFIWIGPAIRGFKAMAAAMSAMALLLIAAAVSPEPAQAFWAQTDRTEAYTILPNQSAFWIPNQGDNKNNQAQLESEDYLNSRKVAAKLFIIPHMKFAGSGGTSIMSGWDYFIPTGRLIIVDRTPQSREWVADHHRGTGNTNEGFPCQSSEGLDVTVGVSIGTVVDETDAAKFLYNFGVVTPKLTEQQEADPNFIFQSVYYGRSLAGVMDDVVRKKVQTLVCKEIAARSLQKDNEEANKIMEAVTKDIATYLGSVGITLKFIGWADTFTFSKDVQDAINRRYVAAQDVEISKQLQPYAETMRALASAYALKSFGEHTNGALPNTVVGSIPDLQTLFGAYLGNAGPFGNGHFPQLNEQQSLPPKK